MHAYVRDIAITAVNWLSRDTYVHGGRRLLCFALVLHLIFVLFCRFAIVFLRSKFLVSFRFRRCHAAAAAAAYIRLYWLV